MPLTASATDMPRLILASACAAAARARSAAWLSIQSFATVSRTLVSGAGAAGTVWSGDTIA